MKFTLKNLYLLICFLTLFQTNTLFAAKEKTISSLSGSNIKALPVGSSALFSLAAEDQMRMFMNTNSYWACRFGNKQSAASVVLRFDDSKRNFETDSWVLNVTYDIKLYDKSSTPYSILTGEVASIDYNSTSNYSDIYLKAYEGALRAEVKITAVQWHVTGTLALPAPPSKYENDIFFEVTQETERFYNMAFNGVNCTPASLQPPVLTTTVSAANLTQNSLATSNNQLPIAWTYIEGAESYDVEWLFVDNGDGSSLPPAGYPLDFRNATRINTTQQHFEIPMVYPNGILVYRVRGVGFSHIAPHVERVEGPWSADGTTTVDFATTNASSFIKTYTGLDPKYNWQYSAVYAEDGKHKEVISYFDGSLRNRQTATVLNTDDNTVIAETKYDFQGRPTVQMLPTPFTNSGIKYYSNFNPSFDKNDFDVDNNFPSGGGTSIAHTQTGDKTHDYYGNNTLATESDAYVPNAQGVPYTQTLYKTDGTGRVVAQSGVGPNHMLGSGHDTRYVYGTPGCQEELDRLFGNEVGNVVHYKKNLMVDANGQVSVTYLDQEGRTIATALSGLTPANLLDIDNKPAPTNIIGDMLSGKNILQGDGRVAKTTFVTSVPNTVYTFTYNLNIDTACYLKASVNSTLSCIICKECVFDLEIKVTGEEGSDITASALSVQGDSYLIQGTSTITAITNTTHPTNGGSAIKTEKISAAIYTVSVTFPNIGSYNIEKVITINQQQLDLYKDDFVTALKTSPCGPLTTGGTLAPCNDCKYICNKQYGIYGPTFITPDPVPSPHPDATTDQLGHVLLTYYPVSATPPALNLAQATAKANLDYETCLSTCDNISVSVMDECQLKASILAKDMSPGGQYFDNLRDQINACGTLSTCVTPCIDQWLLNNVSTNANFSWTNFNNAILSSGCVTATISVSNQNWNYIRTNWQHCFADYLIQFHPEYSTYNFYCGNLVLCNQSGLRTTAFINTAGTISVDANVSSITMKHSSLYDKILKSENTLPASLLSSCTNCFSNPIGFNSSASSDPQNYVSNLAQLSPVPAIVTSSINTNEFVDPLFKRDGDCNSFTSIRCSSGSSTIYNIMTNYLKNYYVDAASTYSLSIWYVLDDPHNIAALSVPPSSSVPYGFIPDQSTIDFFKSFHVGPNAILANSTKYEVFKNIYTGYKQFLLYGLLQTSYTTTPTCAITNSYSASPSLFSDIANPGFTACTNTLLPHELPHAQIRYPRNEIFDIMLTSCPDFTVNTAMQTAISGFTTTNVELNCENNCAGYADGWITEIKKRIAACSLGVISNSVTILSNIRHDLIEICVKGCDGANPQGQSIVPSGISGVPASDNASVILTSFNDVYNHYLGSGTAFASCSALINNINITHPKSAVYSQANCTCDNIKEFALNNGVNWNLSDASLASSIATQMNAILDLTYTVTTADVCGWLRNCFDLPVANSCYLSGYSPPPKSISSFTNAINDNVLPPTLLCPQSQPTLNNDPCDSDQAQADLNYADSLMEQQAVDSALQGFISNYLVKCLSKLTTNESMISSYALDEYYYTLYYYDQAGNLIKTVPPQGFRPLTVSQIAGAGNAGSPYTTKNVAQHRQDPTTYPDFVWPFHTLVTNYKYNTLNQLREQTTPDGGKTNFYYDALGRLIVSQNAKQANFATKAFSYTLYDALSRIKEVGELATNDPMTQDIAKSDNQFTTWFNAVTYSHKRQITRTYYDEAPRDEQANFFVFSPKSQGIYSNLGYQRNRVSCVTYIENDFDHSLAYNSLTRYYDNASHYSYDMHGNVRTLYLENRDLSTFDYSLNKIDYNYDLISGKVNEVHYNSGKIDQFHHRYNYDADNRITAVYTSKNDLLWEKESKYFYYKHGPLSRVEIGDKQVQATDYAYTLHGWIKGVNSNSLEMLNDIGVDGYKAPGSQNLNSVFAKDAYGYSLDYYQGDYLSKGALQSNAANYFLADKTNINTMLTTSLQDDIYSTQNTAPNKDLFNGNISAMATSIYTYNPSSFQLEKSSQLRTYRYDQLNRVMRAYSHNDISSNAWASSTNGFSGAKYKEAFQYDYNGNIIKAKRFNKTGAQFDALDYMYNTGLVNLNTIYSNAPSTTILATNKLYNVSDNVTLSGVETGDVDHQSGSFSTSDPDTDPTLNYNYDKIGNLTKDNVEEIANIEWTVYGKIKKIIRTASSTKDDLEFVYDASGNRIEKITKPHATLTDPATYTKTFYVRDAQGNVMAVYKQENESGTQKLKLLEQNIFGSLRVGLVNRGNNYRIDVNAEMIHKTDFSPALGANGWAALNATSWVTGDEKYIVYVNANNTNSGAVLNLSLTQGKTYEITYDIDMQFVEPNVLNTSVIDVLSSTVLVKNVPVNGTNAFRFTAKNTTPQQTAIKILNTTASNPSYSFLLDNITIKEVTTNRVLGEKEYELSNHLGNVLTVVSDKRKLVETECQALYFDGDDDYVNIPHNSSYNFGTGDFTIEARIKANSTQTDLYPVVIANRNTALGYGSGFTFYLINGQLTMYMNGSDVVSTTADMRDNQWHHVAVTRTGGSVALYVDGTSISTAVNSGNINTGYPLWVGMEQFGPTVTAFKGNINELRFWNIARSQADLNNKKESHLLGSENGLVGYWKMNEGNGQQILDYSTTSNNASRGATYGTGSEDPSWQVTNCLPEDSYTYYTADILNATDYYSFGSPMSGRTYTPARSIDRYRYGFNGKENDNEVVGTGEGTQDYGFRIYNPALGRFLSVDPLSKEYPWYTPYQFAGNKPIWAIDLDGLEEYYVTESLGKNGYTRIYEKNPDLKARARDVGKFQFKEGGKPVGKIMPLTPQNYGDLTEINKSGNVWEGARITTNKPLIRPTNEQEVKEKQNKPTSEKKVEDKTQKVDNTHEAAEKPKETKYLIFDIEVTKDKLSDVAKDPNFDDYVKEVANRYKKEGYDEVRFRKITLVDDTFTSDNLYNSGGSSDNVIAKPKIVETGTKKE